MPGPQNAQRQPTLGEQHDHERRKQHVGQALGGLQQPHGDAQVLVEPHRDGRDQRDLENGQGGAHENAEVQDELPGDGDQTDQHRGGEKQQGAHGHGAAEAVAVAQPAGRRPEDPREDPLQR